MLSTTKKNIDIHELKLIFKLQIGLLLTLALLFLLGRFFENLHVGSFFFAVTMGALGASVSLMKRVMDDSAMIKTSDAALKKYAVYIPILYGTLMSGIAYLFFMSGLLSGDAIVASIDIAGNATEGQIPNSDIGGNGLLRSNLFPNFTKPPETGNLLQQFIHSSPASIQSLGKLLVWCFIAGYSERFVTGILEQLENKGE